MAAPITIQINTRGATLLPVITIDSVIDDNLKSQLKNRTLDICKLFLLTWISQYFSNWSKVFELSPTSFFSKHKVINVEFFSR